MMAMPEDDGTLIVAMSGSATGMVKNGGDVIRNIRPTISRRRSAVVVCDLYLARVNDQ